MTHGLRRNWKLCRPSTRAHLLICLTVFHRYAWNAVARCLSCTNLKRAVSVMQQALFITPDKRKVFLTVLVGSVLPKTTSRGMDGWTPNVRWSALTAASPSSLVSRGGSANPVHIPTVSATGFPSTSTYPSKGWSYTNSGLPVPSANYTNGMLASVFLQKWLLK